MPSERINVPQNSSGVDAIAGARAPRASLATAFFNGVDFTPQQRALVQLAHDCFIAAIDELSGYNKAVGFTPEDYVRPEEGIKGTHRVDEIAEIVIAEKLAQFSPVKLHLYSELATERRTGAEGTVFLDVIDGSRNLERLIGNPAFAFGYTSKTGGTITLNDLELVYVHTYLTGEIYCAIKGGGALHYHPFDEAIAPGRTSGMPAAVLASGPETLSEAVCYLRPGYGYAEKQLEESLPLFFGAKDIRSFDNTIVELCEVARGAAHLIYDARDASDRINLLPWLVIKEAKGIMRDLEGKEIGGVDITKPKERFNFMAASNPTLLAQAMTLLQEYNDRGTKELVKQLFPQVEVLLQLCKQGAFKAQTDRLLGYLQNSTV